MDPNQIFYYNRRIQKFKTIFRRNNQKDVLRNIEKWEKELQENLFSEEELIQRLRKILYYCQKEYDKQRKQNKEEKEVN